MRIAIVSDVHGNLSALEAVVLVVRHRRGIELVVAAAVLLDLDDERGVLLRRRGRLWHHLATWTHQPSRQRPGPSAPSWSQRASSLVAA